MGGGTAKGAFAGEEIAGVKLMLACSGGISVIDIGDGDLGIGGDGNYGADG